jgi:hypothetical protein
VKRAWISGAVDREAFTVEPFKGGAHLAVGINVLFALVDLTPENGATVILAGTHRSLDVPVSVGNYPDFVCAVMPAGCAVM